LQLITRSKEYARKEVEAPLKGCASPVLCGRVGRMKFVSKSRDVKLDFGEPMAIDPDIGKQGVILVVLQGQQCWSKFTFQPIVISSRSKRKLPGLL
jgi:hypothetical protein